MAESDWTFLPNSLDENDTARGPSRGYTPPNGGGSFCFGFKSLANVAGAVAKRVNVSNFNPVAAGKGISIRAAIQRGGGIDGTAFMFGALNADDVAGAGYMLGFAHDEEPAHLILRKGTPISGLPETDTSVLRKSVASYLSSTWVHLKLDILVQPHGDVHLQVFQSDLDNQDVTNPEWQEVAGMAEYIDDKNGINSGSLPYNGGGYVGVGFYKSNIGRTALIDHVRIGRAL